MSNSKDSLQQAEARVAASRRQLAQEFDALKSTMIQKARSPYIIGGLAAAAVVAAYLMYRRSQKPRRVYVQPAPSRLGIVLTAAQLLAPLVMGAKRIRPASKEPRR